MGAIAELLTSAATKITGGSLQNPPMWLRMLLGGGTQTASGVAVSEDTAMTYTAVWAAVNIISGGVGVLPQIVYKRVKPRGKTRDLEHPAYRLMHDRANPYMSAQLLRETVQAHVLLWGNGYIEVERDGGGRPVALWPLLPNATEPKKTAEGKLFYETRTPSGNVVPLDAENVMHIRGLGFDGFKGYSVIGYHRESVGLGLATQKFGARFFGNGAHPGGVLEHPGKLSPEASVRLRESWAEMHAGLDNAHRVAILEEGLKWHETGMPLDDAQFIETQKFGLSNISRIFQVPPNMLADLDKATFSNIEHQGIEFVTWTLYRWLKKWESESNEKLLATSQRTTHFMEFMVDAFLRGDFKTRNEGYAIARQWGWMSKNDVRDKENMNPIEDGDSYASLAELQASKVAPAAEAPSVRQQVASAMLPALSDVIRRMAHKEANDARRAIKKDQTLATWAAEYYAPGSPAEAAFRLAIGPAVHSAAGAIWAAAGQQSERDVPDTIADAAAVRHRRHCVQVLAVEGQAPEALESMAEAEARLIVADITERLVALTAATAATDNITTTNEETHDRN